MATHGKRARTYINGIDMSSYLNKFGVDNMADTVETSAFSSSDKTYVVGLKDATISAEGFFAGSTYQTDSVFSSILGSTEIWSFYPAGPTFGNAGYGVKAIETAYNISSPIDGVVSITADGQAVIGADRIVSYHALTAVSSSGSDVAVDGGSTSLLGATAYLQVTNVSSTVIEIGVTVQHSSAGISWANIISFTSGAGIRAERSISSSTKIKRYLRSNWMLSSSSGSVTFNVGVKRR